MRGMALNWFHYYLNNRIQLVNVNDVSSTLPLLPITGCVPQGSILGPLLFILYITDLVNSSKLSKFVIFADDTNLFFKDKDLNTIVYIINTELVKISKWCKLNELT